MKIQHSLIENFQLIRKNIKLKFHEKSIEWKNMKNEWKILLLLSRKNFLFIFFQFFLFYNNHYIISFYFLSRKNQFSFSLFNFNEIWFFMLFFCCFRFVSGRIVHNLLFMFLLMINLFDFYSFGGTDKILLLDFLIFPRNFRNFPWFFKVLFVTFEPTWRTMCNTCEIHKICGNSWEKGKR